MRVVMRILCGFVSHFRMMVSLCGIMAHFCTMMRRSRMMVVVMATAAYAKQGQSEKDDETASCHAVSLCL